MASRAENRAGQGPNTERQGGESLADLLQAAEIAADQQQLERAVEILREAVRRYPASPEALYELGVAIFMLLESRYSHLDMWENLESDEPLAEECARALESAIEKKANWASPLTALGNLMALRGNLQRAVELWRRSLEQDPNQPEVAESLKNFESQPPGAS